MAQNSRLIDGLRALDPTIAELLAISGSPGLSVGVLYQGEIIHTNHWGRRDINEANLPDDETIYPIASMTKLLTATAIALLVEQGQVQWETRIRDILPEFKRRKDVIGREATLIDVLANRTGLATANPFWAQSIGEILIPKSQMVPMACTVQATKPFREAFLYTNWNYALATDVVEELTGDTFGTFVNKTILEPLNMKRTTLGDVSTYDNFADAHAIHNDGTACKIALPACSDETGMAGGTGGKSSIHDLLLMYKSLLSAYTHQTKSNLTSTPGSPFKQVQTIFSPQIHLSKRQSARQSYCLGLYKTELPGNVSVASINHAFLGSLNKPFPGRAKPGVEVFHHNGLLPGGIGSMFLIPSSETAVVVLTNSLPLSDPTDFAGRLILSVLLNEKPPSSFAKLSELVKQNQLNAHISLATKLAKGKTGVPPRHPLSAYQGDYFNNIGNYFIRVEAQESQLLMIVQGMKLTRSILLPYDGDTFYWPANREQEICVDYRFPFIIECLHKISFSANKEGNIEFLAWQFEETMKPEVFRKRSGGWKIDQAKL